MRAEDSRCGEGNACQDFGGSFRVRDLLGSSLSSRKES